METAHLLIQLILGLTFLNFAYYIGKLCWALKYGIGHRHYFLGIGPKLFSINLQDKKFTVGIYLPVYGFGRIFNYESGYKTRAYAPWEFHEHALYKRLLTVIGGAISLGVSGTIIFIVLSYIETTTYVSKKEVNKYGIYPSELAIEAGFQTGDKITMLNAKDFKSYTDLLYPSEGFRYSVLRNGMEQELAISKEVASKLKTATEPFLSVFCPFLIKSCIPSSEAEKIGLLPGDQIKSVNSVPIVTIQEFKKVVRSDDDGIIDLTVHRKGSSDETVFSGVNLNEHGNLGITTEDGLQQLSKHKSIFEAVVEGISKSYTILTSNVAAIFSIFSGEVAQSKTNIGGPIGIATIFSGRIDWPRFWSITAFLSLFGAFTSLLPLPRTCFWDLVPLFYESTTKKIFPLQWYIKMRKAGVYLVIAFMAYIIMSDLSQLF